MRRRSSAQRVPRGSPRAERMIAHVHDDLLDGIARATSNNGRLAFGAWQGPSQ